MERVHSPSSGLDPRAASGPNARPTSSGSRQPDAGVWEHLAGPLSSVAMRLRSLRSRQAASSLEARELDALIVEVDRAFSTVMRTPASADHDDVPLGRPPDSTPNGRSRIAASSRAGAGTDGETRRDFDRWVEAGCPPLLSRRSETSRARADELLGQLTEEFEPMPETTTRALGLVGPCSYGRASRLLLWARHASNGPHCRSYGSARYFLAGATPDALPTTPLPVAMSRHVDLEVDHRQERT
jgi:hypothetical protein